MSHNPDMLFIGGGSGGLGVTNYIATDFHLKTGVWLMFHFYGQVQDNSRHFPEMFRQCVEFYLLMVGSGFTSNDASKENNRIIFYGFMKAKLSTYFE